MNNKAPSPRPAARRGPRHEATEATGFVLAAFLVVNAACDPSSSGQADGDVRVPSESISMPLAEGESGNEEQSDEAFLGDIAPAPPPIHLRWTEIPADTDLVTADSSTALTVINASETSMWVDLLYAADLGGTQTYDGQVFSVLAAANGETSVTINLEDLLPTLDTTYSGSLIVIGRFEVLNDSAFDGSEVAQTFSDAIYFHRDADSTRIYNEDVLVETYRAGDFQALLAASGDLIDEELGAQVTRILDGSEPSGGFSELEAIIGVEDDGNDEKTGSPHGASSDLMIEPPNPVAGYPHALCLNIKVETNDSGFVNTAGLTEDIWSNANTGIYVYAEGVPIRIGTTAYTTDSWGCVQFRSSKASFTADLWAATKSTDASGRFVRIHNNMNYMTQDPSPNYAYSQIQTGVPFSTGTTTFRTLGGGGSPIWSALMIFRKSLSTYNALLGAGTEFHISPRSPCLEANYNYHNDPSSNRSYIRIQEPGCPGESIRSKFVISHEYGHAYLMQVAGLALPSAGSHNHSNTLSNCDFDASGSFSYYGNETQEYSALAMNEGAAHYVSARVWNHANSDGQFRWAPSSYRLEGWDAMNTSGGWMINECCNGLSASNCATNANGAGVIPDWMRALWDIRTDSLCTLSDQDVAVLYGATVTPGFTNTNAWTRSKSTVAFWWNSTCQQRWDFIGCWNGIHMTGQQWSPC